MKKGNQELNSSLYKLANSAIVILFGMILSKVFTYVYRIIIARGFGPDVYGMYSLAVDITSLLVFTSLLGFDSGLVRYVALFRAKKQDHKIKYLFRFTIKTVILLSFILGIILFALSELIATHIFHEPQLGHFLRIFSLAVPIGTLTSYFLAALVSYEKVGWHSFIENISKNATNIVFIVLLISLGFEMNSVPFSYLLGSLAVLVMSFLVVRKFVPIVFQKPEETSSEERLKKEFLSYSVPMLFFGVLNFIMVWIDSFSLGYFKSATEVGFYNAAVPIALLLNIAPALFIRLLFPLITKEYGRKKIQTIRELIKQVGKWIFLINIPLSFLIFIFPEQFLGILFGKEYLISAAALRILVVNVLIVSVLRISNRVIAMVGKSRTLLYDTLVAMVLNLALNILFIPIPTVIGLDNESGLVGAALATMIANVFLVVLFVLQARKYLSAVPIRRKMLNLLFAAIVSAGVIFVLTRMVNELTTMTFVMLSVLFVLLYLLLLVFFRGLDRNDLSTLKSLEKKMGLRGRTLSGFFRSRDYSEHSEGN